MRRAVQRASTMHAGRNLRSARHLRGGVSIDAGQLRALMNALALSAIVLVEVVNSGAVPAGLADALADACTLALRQESTCISDARPSTDDVVARAFVKWSASGQEAFIEVEPPPRRPPETIRR